MKALTVHWPCPQASSQPLRKLCPDSKGRVLESRPDGFSTFCRNVPSISKLISLPSLLSNQLGTGISKGFIGARRRYFLGSLVPDIVIHWEACK